MVLLLTGSIQSAKNMCNSYLTTFSEYEWTWKEDIDKILGRLKAFRACCLGMVGTRYITSMLHLSTI